MFATLVMTALLASSPAGNSQQAGVHQDHGSQAATMVCAHCAASHASSSSPGWGDTRRDNPHSTVVEDDRAPVRSASNDEINAAESGNPESVDFSYGTATVGSEPGNFLSLEEAESGLPDSVQSARRPAVAVVAATPAPKCSCLASNARHAAAAGQH
jgi:hypothetical protein